MSLFSFFKKKKNKPSPDTSDVSVAEDALEAILTTNVKPKKSFVSIASLFRPTQKITNTLVKGSSDSKPAEPNVIEDQQTGSINRDSVNVTTRQNFTNVTHIRTTSLLTQNSSRVTNDRRLYPDLNSINVEECSSRATQNAIRVRTPESIHDIAGEICFMIQPSIVNAITMKKRLSSLRNDIQSKVLAIVMMGKNPSKLEYSFKKELDVDQNYSSIRNVKKLHAFNDVKKCHQKVNNLMRRKNVKSANAIPIFPSYHAKFRCYRGQNSDVIDCD